MADIDELEGAVLERLMGRFSFLQTREEQEQLIREAASQVNARLSEKDRTELARRMLSYGIIDEFMRAPDIEDIMVNALNPIYIFRQKIGMVRTDRKFRNARELENFVQKLLVLSGKGKLDHINNIHLPNGSRANIVSSPFGYQITIRKFTQVPLSIIDLVESGTMSYDIAAQLWLYAEGLGIKPANILIGGMPGSGKTTLLNALFSFFPTNERIVVIEDTLELNTRSRENCARLEAAGELTMRDLVKNSLRMRPDRLIVGEVRGEEASDMMTAMNIGKICMGTIHASSPREIVMRLQNAPMDVPMEIIPLIDVFVVMRNFYSKGTTYRVVSQISETGGIEKKVLLSDLAVFDVSAGKIVESHPSVIYRDRLAQVAGINPKEILDEMGARSKILQQLAKQGKRTIEDISAFCADYYNEPDDALKKHGIKL